MVVDVNCERSLSVNRNIKNTLCIVILYLFRKLGIPSIMQNYQGVIIDVTDLLSA